MKKPMTKDEMLMRVGPFRATVLSHKAAQIVRANNSSPGVDQGGQYVWTSVEKEFEILLRKEIEKMGEENG